MLEDSNEADLDESVFNDDVVHLQQQPDQHPLDDSRYDTLAGLAGHPMMIKEVKCLLLLGVFRLKKIYKVTHKCCIYNINMIW